MTGGTVTVVAPSLVRPSTTTRWDTIWSNCHWKEPEEVNKCVEVSPEVCEKPTSVTIYDPKVFPGLTTGHMDPPIGPIMDER